MSCPLCSSALFQIFDTDKIRQYCQCEQCSMIYVPRSELISLAEEEKRYDSHENAADDSTYVAYLAGTRDQVLPFLSAHQRGLDFGCGKTELLSQLFAEYGHLVDSYDIFFQPREEIWRRTYDFIILSEVIEHLREPLETMKVLRSLLKAQGQIFIKTKFHPSSKEEFKNWFYKRDKTHIQFFNPSSMNFLGSVLGASGVEFLGQDLTQLRFP